MMINDDFLGAMNLSKPDIGKYVVGTEGGFSAAISLDGLSFATSTCAEFSESIKKGLLSSVYRDYGYIAPAKSGVRIGVLVMLSATHDAPSVFFCVVGLAHPFSSDAVIIRAAHEVMVGWVGASKDAPVSDNAGYANPAQLTTSEIGVSGGGDLTQLSEAAICWLLPSPKNRKFVGLSPLFGAIARQSSLLSSISKQIASVMRVAHLLATMSPSSWAVSLWGLNMLRTYDLPSNPVDRVCDLISLTELMRDVHAGDSDCKDEYVSALISMMELALRDLRSLLEGNEIPGGNHEKSN
ncbi:ash family protein [Serratia sp. CY71090]|uniref:ash family protein n=1 Tax=Serratia sp. CY71090 TaxID=3383672 RepID=UPI003FA0F3B7